MKERWFCPHCNKEVVPVLEGFDFGKIDKIDKITDKMAERIYKRYPRRVGHDAAIKAIKKALKHCNQRELARKVKAYSKSVEGVEKKFIPHPSTWFNQGRWKDDLEVEDAKESGKEMRDPKQIKCKDKIVNFIEQKGGIIDESDLKRIKSFIFFLYTLNLHRMPKVLYFWGDGKLDLYLFISDYLQYVDNQTWLECPSIKAFDHKSKLFNRYVIHLRNDIGFDILTGKVHR